jgi:hypothetical protein
MGMIIDDFDELFTFPSYYALMATLTTLTNYSGSVWKIAFYQFKRFNIENPSIYST